MEKNTWMYYADVAVNEMMRAIRTYWEAWKMFRNCFWLGKWACNAATCYWIVESQAADVGYWVPAAASDWNFCIYSGEPVQEKKLTLVQKC